jgi:hypothetical protein
MLSDHLILALVAASSLALGVTRLGRSALVVGADCA